MRIFIERFILGILPPLVLLLATNPLGFSWPLSLRIIGIIVVFVVAGIAAYFAGWDEWRWERLRGLWWLWSIFGLVGGLALPLWVTPLIVRPQAEENPAELVSLRAELNARTQDLERAKKAASESKPAAPPVQVHLAGVGTIEVPYIRNMGPLNTLNRFSLAKEIGKKLEGQDIAFLITAPRENVLLKYDLEMMLNAGGLIKAVQRAYKGSTTI
jgi:hypothetical protein